MEDKATNLKSVRRSKGLCFKCGDKWGPNHTCPAQVPIHVIEELLEFFQVDDRSDTKGDSDSDEGAKVSSISEVSTSKMKRHKTIRLLGMIGQQQILVLIDYGSVGTFVSEAMVQRLTLSTVSVPAMQYSAADGSPMHSNKMLSHLEWLVQGHTFCHSARVIPLGCYDLILGADWLEEHSPMWVHWGDKVMKFDHAGKRITLTGITDDISQCPPVSARGLKGMLKRRAVAHCIELGTATLSMPASDSLVAQIIETEIPAEIQEVLQQYQHLFEEPKELPPSRSFDHHIPLVPGAQPVNIRPYRYSPHQKTEIEKQVQMMLDKGVIQPSSSPFASSVLLVKKKKWNMALLCGLPHVE